MSTSKKIKLTRAIIIDNILEKLKIKYKKRIDKKYIKSIMDLLFDEIKDGLLRDEIIELRSFGTFEVKFRKGKSNARNPQTGQPIKVEDHSIATFKPGKDLKSKVWSLKTR